MSARPLLDALAADPQKALAEIAAERARRRAVAAGKWSFAEFAQNAWPVVDQRPVVWSWYLEELCHHLEACARRRILRLVGNGPPRNGKSNVFAIMWPAWVWATLNPSEAFIYLSYSDDLVTEHSVKCRALIESGWYQDTFRPEWRLGHTARSEARDGASWRFAHGNRQDDFVNTAGGRRIASPVSAGITGRGAGIIAIDDPLSAEEANSAAARDKAERVINQAVSTRFNDPATGVAVMLMQRVHPDDPSKGAIARGWKHFCVPMEFVPEKRGRTHTDDGAIFWEDPRTRPGEPLAPQRFTPEYLRQVKASFTLVGYAAQFQQAPLAHAEAGKYFNRSPSGSPLRFLDAAPLKVKRRVRAWDLASTDGGGDWTVGVRLALLEDDTMCVEDVVRGQWGPRTVRATVKATAELDGQDVEVTLPQDPGQAGKDQVQEYITMLLGWTVVPRRPTADKTLRAGPASAQWMAGNVSVVRAAWNEPFLQVLEAFPDPSAHDDDVDAIADGVAHVAKPLTTADYWAQAAAQEPEVQDEIEKWLHG